MCRFVAKCRQSPKIPSQARSRAVSANHVEHERPRLRLVADLVRREKCHLRRLGGLDVTCMHLGERLAGGDLLSALAYADDTHSVVYRLPRGPPARPPPPPPHR